MCVTLDPNRVEINQKLSLNTGGGDTKEGRKVDMSFLDLPQAG